MYVQSARIQNVRSVVDFAIKFDRPSGWHVLIGDNGSGKSTIMRSIALALVGLQQSSGLRTNWADWLNPKTSPGSIALELTSPSSITSASEDSPAKSFDAWFGWAIKDDVPIAISSVNGQFHEEPWRSDLFSVAYGPYRRFEGGNPELEKLFEGPSFATLAAHLSIFGEDVALTEPIKWLKQLNYRALEQDQTSSDTLKNLKKLINSQDFLPHGTLLDSVGSQGVFFKDGNGTTVAINQMSDGYRSVLSLTFELIRQLVRVYGSEAVFKNIEQGEMFIDLPGVVLVDEIDAHLHPTWQTRIGQWFLRYFPKLQFIVTTHSPLVCRAAEKGSIWRLAAPGTNEESREITGPDRDRLIFGNVLDAYGTEVFGKNVDISQSSVESQVRLARLSKKKMLDDISPEEDAMLDELKKVFTTNAPIEL